MAEPPLYSVRHLRTIVRAMGRPNNNQRVIFKMQSGTVPYNDLLRAAFPQTPFIFVFREPGQVGVAVCGSVCGSARQ